MKQIPNNVQEDVNLISPQKALAMGKSNMDYKPVEKGGIHKPGNPSRKSSKGGY